LVASFAPVTQWMIAAAGLAPGMHVLDVGGGIGDPALAAAMAVSPGGSVRSLDLSAGMLATARDRARAYGLTNVRFEVGAVEDVELAEGHFDAVLARFSVMFFPNIALGLRRLFAALQPGGRIVVAAWAQPELNEGFVFPTRVLREVVDVAPSDPDAPGPFRLSGDGELAGALRAAGFRDVGVEDVQLYLFARDPAAYWSMICDVSDSFRRLIAGLDESARQRVRARMLTAVEVFRLGEVLRLPVRARIGHASKRLI
jgi:SAM-dependent methyltransferase